MVRYKMPSDTFLETSIVAYDFIVFIIRKYFVAIEFDKRLDRGFVPLTNQLQNYLQARVLAYHI